jgi:hypothetical protein
MAVYAFIDGQTDGRYPDTHALLSLQLIHFLRTNICGLPCDNGKELYRAPIKGAQSTSLV